VNFGELVGPAYFVTCDPDNPAPLLVKDGEGRIRNGVTYNAMDITIHPETEIQQVELKK
jgi:hypothetical protein